jgi:ribosomal protein S18 acetylase RimI-like enzyme
MGSTSLLRERLKFVRADGGKTSALWWLAGKAGGVETHHVFSRDLAILDTREPAPVGTESLHTIRSSGAALEIDAVLRDQLEHNFALGVTNLAAAGWEIYFLSAAGTIVSQLLIRPGPRIALDVPTGIELDIGIDRAFLSYLYTSPAHRRSGAARRLLESACSQLSQRRYGAIIAHVRATNVPSLNAFRTGGWKQIGTIWTGRSRNWLRCTRLEMHGITATRTLDRPIT